jgi:hypothetical protein
MTSSQTPARGRFPVTATGGHHLSPAQPDGSAAAAPQHRYYVTYAHGRDHIGFGSAEVALGNPITSMQDVATLTAYFKARGAHNVVVLWWTEMFAPPATTPGTAPHTPAGGTQ